MINKFNIFFRFQKVRKSCTHFWPMFPFYTPLKAPSNQRFSCIFRWCKMRPMTRNGFKNLKLIQKLKINAKRLIPWTLLSIDLIVSWCNLNPLSSFSDGEMWLLLRTSCWALIWGWQITSQNNSNFTWFFHSSYVTYYW